MNMLKYATLFDRWEKLLSPINRLYSEVSHIDLSRYENRYVFALKVQQLYTAIEDFVKEIPKVRPPLFSGESLILLNKLGTFRHLIWHAYDCELDEKELEIILQELKGSFHFVENDFAAYASSKKRPAKLLEKNL